MNVMKKIMKLYLMKFKLILNKLIVIKDSEFLVMDMDSLIAHYYKNIMC